nr:MAG TPA: hypothetical protein [Caudoviricetes sp.]
MQGYWRTSGGKAYQTRLRIPWPPTACGGSTRKGRKEPFSLTRQPKVVMSPCVRG